MRSQRDACKACHMVDSELRPPRIFEIGPAFRDIANTPGMTATAIRVFLTSSHHKIPARLFQIGRVEAFGEPAVDRREEVPGFGTAARHPCGDCLGRTRTC